MLGRSVLVAVSTSVLLAVSAPGLHARQLNTSQFGPSAVFNHQHDGPYSERLRHLEEQFRCSCGCTLDLHHCQLGMQCGTSPGWARRILQALERGEADELIQASFVSDFGSTILMAPPARGFNLLGYFLPGSLMLVVAGLGAAALHRKIEAREVVVFADTGQDVDWDLLRSEIRRMEEGDEPLL